MQVYLIESASHVKLEEEMSKIIGDSSNKIIYNALENELADILNEASYVSMFDEMKYLVVKNANFFGSLKLKEKEEEMLQQYLASPYPLCTIIFTTYDAIDQRKKTTKLLLEKHHYIKIPNSKGLELYSDVANLLIQKKYYAEKDTINFLINSCLGNYDLIWNEIEKIDLYYAKPTKLNIEKIKNIISKTMNDNHFKFIDAVLEKDLKKSMNLLDDLITMKTEPLSLINLMAREYRNMIEMRYMINQKYSNKEMKEELHMQDWQLEKLRKNAMNYHEDDLKDYLIRLEKLDYNIKSGQIDKLVGLQLFLIDLYEY